MITIEIDDRQVRFSPFISNIVPILRPPMVRSVARLISDLASYPPAPPTSRYRRTGTLGRRWTSETRVTSDSLRGEIGNNTSYGPFVQSSEDQAHMHVGRWQTDQQVADDNEATIVSDFERAIRAAL